MEDITTVLQKAGSVPAVISKDECIYCFENSNNSKEGIIKGHNHSLNVCLDCFQAVCNRDIPFHAKVTSHSNGQAHEYYLNIRKLEKETTLSSVPGSPDSNSNKKLKLQVIEKSDDEIYETKWELVHWENSASTPTILLANSEETPDLVTRILSAKSQRAIDQATSWELQIKACPHTRDFVVPQNAINIDLSKCENCELNENLWLCLYCGHIGCGRQQVGIDGNTHALNHYETCNDHPLAIKLGSLSENSNDMYCYSCDDEVKFEDIKTLIMTLAQFGIDLSGKNATEKTLTELQVEQNMNWDFKMTDSQGNELIKLSPNKKVGCGLINLGNSCYLNSILQSLFNNEMWVDNLVKFVGEEFPLDVVFPSNNLRSQLIKLFKAIKVEPERYPDGIKPESFKKCIGGKDERFSAPGQQDAMEFLTFFITRLDKQLSMEINNEFRFNIEDRLECSECHGMKFSSQIMEFITVPLNSKLGSQSLTHQLSLYFHSNDQDDIQFTCTKCHTRRKGIKKISLETAPGVLVLNPARMEIDETNWTERKTSSQLKYDEVITLDDFITNRTGNEVILPEEENTDSEETHFKADEIVLEQLKEMGFGENACIKACYHTGNGSNAEIATQWLFEHIEDHDINDPLVIANIGKKNDDDVDKEKLTTMISMGLESQISKKALILNDGDVEKSINWVFNNPDDNGELDAPMKEETNNAIGSQGKLGHVDIKGISYELYAVVCHKGNSTHSGHYVTFVKNDSHWILYNDEKIVSIDSVEEIERNGFIFFYKRK